MRSGSLCLLYSSLFVNILVHSFIRRLSPLTAAGLRFKQSSIPNMAKLIDGNAIAAQIRVELTEKVKEVQETYGVTPGLAVVLVGGRTDSATYVRMKKKACTETGIASYGFDYGADVSEEELLAKIHELNAGKCSNWGCFNLRHS